MSTTQSQKVSKKSRRRRTVTSGFSVKSALWSAVYYPAKVAARASSYVVSHPRAALFVAVPASVFLLLASVKMFLSSYHEKILPASVDVYAADTRLAARIRTVTDSTIKEAKKLHQSRTQFLQSLSRSLEEVEGIDEFWLRLGFDKRLQITATQEVAVLLLETGGGDRYLIGHKLKVIAKNPQSIGEKQLLRVTVPELKMRGGKQTVHWKGQNKFTRSIDAARFSAENVSLPWLFRQAQTLQTALAKTNLHLGIDKVIWKTHTGFSLQMNGEAPLQILLGEGELAKKIDKLSEVLADLKTRKISAEVIDLNYADKAIIKMSEQTQNRPL